MNRFFSKLDLRDIRIDPRSSHFPPDGTDEMTEVDEASQATTLPGNDEEALATDHEDTEAAAEEIGEVWFQPEPAAQGRSSSFAENEESATRSESDEVLKVSARSRPSAVAGAIAGVVRECGRAEVQAIGAGATNQAVKAVAIARDYLRETGIEAVCLPAFIDVTIENEDRTAIRLVIEPR
jgi:stage V sporulation protein S